MHTHMFDKETELSILEGEGTKAYVPEVELQRQAEREAEKARIEAEKAAKLAAKLAAKEAKLAAKQPKEEAPVEEEKTVE